MTDPQRLTYFRLWNAACKVRKMDPKDAELRQSVTMAVTGKASVTELNNGEITVLFNRLKWLIDPSNLDAALADADPAEAMEANHRDQIIWRINKTAARKGLSPAYLATAAEGKTRAHRVKSWEDLPTAELLKFSFTIASRKGTADPF